MTRHIPGALIFIGLVLSLSFAARAQPAAAKPADAIAKVRQFLKKSPYKVEAVTKNIWTLDNRVIVTAEADYVIAFSILARKAHYQPTADALSAMLKYAGEADFIKIVIDLNDDLVLRIESKTKGMNQKDFDAMVEQVFAASDAAAAKLKPHLVK